MQEVPGQLEAGLGGSEYVCTDDGQSAPEFCTGPMPHICSWARERSQLAQLLLMPLLPMTVPPLLPCCWQIVG